MGSLLPGWDERQPGVAPKAFQDYKEEDDDVGYFAAYEKRKQAQKQGGEPASPIAIGNRTGSLSRRSMPGDRPQRLSPSSSLSRASMPAGAAREWGPGTPRSARSLSRAETMAAAPGLRRHSQGSGGPAGPHGLQRMASMPMTRGERSDILAGMLPSSPASSTTPRSPGLDAYKTHQPDKDRADDYQWWRRFDSAAMNERPDEPVSKEKGYVPQYGVTGQGVHYHDADAVELGLSTIQAH